MSFPQTQCIWSKNMANQDTLTFAFGENSAKTKPYTITELTKKIKLQVEEIGSVWLMGEISNLKYHSSGHIYLTLKDSENQVVAVIWRCNAKNISAPLKDGLEVLVHGELTVYGPQSKYQISIDTLELRGQGALLIAFENLKHKLAALGYFDPRHKKSLPSMPRKIGIITSPTGAAVQDMINVIQRRFAKVVILIYPVRVQGEGAAQEVANAIYCMNNDAYFRDIEVLIVGRGGGSLEDLWAFNEEVVAKAIFESRIPIISAVGHEIDITISDLVADRRALTPSEAGELVVPRYDQILQILQTRTRQLQIAMQSYIHRARAKLDRLATHRALVKPMDRLHHLTQRVDILHQRLQNALFQILQQQAWLLAQIRNKLLLQQPNNRLQRFHQHLEQLEMRLERAMMKRLEWEHRRLRNFETHLTALSPLAVLNRGYSIAYIQSGKSVITNHTQVQPGDYIWTRLADSWILSRVSKTGSKAIKTSDKSPEPDIAQNSL